LFRLDESRALLGYSDTKEEEEDEKLKRDDDAIDVQDVLIPPEEPENYKMVVEKLPSNEAFHAIMRQLQATGPTTLSGPLLERIKKAEVWCLGQ